MEDKKIKISLKYKLLLLLTLIPVVSLMIYISIATRLFKDDKIAYVKDSSVAVAKALATQLKLEINGFVEKIDVDRIRVNYNNAKTASKQMIRGLALNYLFLKFQ